MAMNQDNEVINLSLQIHFYANRHGMRLRPLVVNMLLVLLQRPIHEIDMTPPSSLLAAFKIIESISQHGFTSLNQINF